jgi:WD40 repeat protein
VHERSARATALAVCLSACAPPDDASVVHFVRGGIVQGGRFDAQPWTPGATVDVAGTSWTAPERSECVPLFHVALGNVARIVAGGQGPPNTALAFSPDGARLAIGTNLGEVLVVDAWSGEVLARRTLPEAVAKEVAWSLDGGTLYVGEQSPDASLRVLDPATLADRATLRLADLVGSSIIPKGADVYALYTLPTVAAIVPLPSGQVVVDATHAWPDASGAQRNASVVVVADRDGAIVRRWPAEPADATFLHAHASPSYSWLAISVGRSAVGPAPDDLPIGGVLALALPSLEPVAGIVAEPIRPAFSSTFVWDGVGATDTAALAGFDDGRVLVRSLPGGEALGEASMGAPILAGDVPIYAGIGWARFAAGGFVVATSGTRIPWGAADPARRPPATHPSERTVSARALDGSPVWSWNGEGELQGLTVSPDGDELVAGEGDRETDHREDLYGALVFTLAAAAGSGDERLEATCPTAGPVFFRHAITADGRIAVTEHPFLDAAGDLQAAYQVTVLR